MAKKKKARKKFTKKKKAKSIKTRGLGKKISDAIDLQKLAMLCQKGFIDRELAQFYGVAESTINRWKKDPGFKEIVARNKAVADDLVENAMYSRAIGMTIGAGTLNEKPLPPDVEAGKF